MDNTQPSFPANTIPEVQSAPVDYQPDAPAPEKTEPVGDYSPSTNALSDEAIANRAPKYHLAMGASSPGVESISARLASGADESIRQDQVTRNELEFQKTKLDVISSLIKNSPEGANADDAEFVRNLPQAALEHSTDPRIVMETSYAKKLLQAVLVHDEQQNFAKVETVNPEEANQKLDFMTVPLYCNFIC